MYFPKILKKIIRQGKEIEKSEFFLAVEVDEAQVKAAVWQFWESSGKIDLKHILSADNLDKAIVQIKEQVKVPLEKLVLGLMPDAVYKDTIKKEVIERIKPTAQKHLLTPVGFVVIPEAIAHFLKKREETPQSAIFLSINKQTITLSLFRGGKSKNFVSAEKSGNLYDDFEKGLSQFASEEVLPSKIVLYDGDDKVLEDIREELLSYPWQKNTKFLHVPKIDILPWDFSIKAIVEAGMHEFAQTGEPDKGIQAETLEKKEEDFGFVENKDIVKTYEEEITGDSLVESPSKAIGEETGVEEDLGEEVEEVPEKKPKLRLSIPKFLNFGKLFFYLSKFTPLKRHKLVPIIIPAIFLGVIFISSLYFYPAAKIKLVAQPNIVDQNVDITINPQISTLNIESNEIPGKIYSISLDGQKTEETTGKKTIGEKAKGEATIYNKTSTEKKFAKGTIITGSSNLTFSLDEDISIASASDTGVSLEYGNAKTRVTAIKIGPLGNIKKDNEFTVDDFAVSSFIVRNEADFSGGTEREIDVVSKEDQDNLLSNLTDDLKNQAKERLDGQILGDEKLLAESVKDNIAEKVFDKEAGDEADNISLKLKIEFSAISYKEEDLNNFLKQYVVDQIPQDFEYDSEKSYFSVKNVNFEENGNVVFNADYHAYLTPKIDTDIFKKKITGKSTENLEEEVRNLTGEGILGYELTYERRFPFLKGTLPFLGKNIEISIVPY